jgi:signal transduction histidine kinase
MAGPLRVLIVEDNEQDAALMLRELRRGDYDVTHELVDTPEAMIAALKKPWDLVLSDFTMPRFSAPAALSLVKERALDLPFIIISGTIGEDTAVTSLRAGAHDFLVKGSLARLVPAIERERREAGVRAERRKMHEQLLISERMASLGMLAAGVAHEINNPLGILLTNLELASEQLTRLVQQVEAPSASCDAGQPGDRRPSAPPVRLAELNQLIEAAQEAAERVRLIARDLRTLSRSNDEEQPETLEIHRVLEASIRMAANEIRHRAQLIRDYGAVPTVRGSQAKLGQVFINLLVNAAHAIPEGRSKTNEIRIVTRTDHDGRAVVEVRDTGSGIAQSNLPRIFDAFFTTKAGSAGTGLGLAICHRIITTHGGVISAESEVGRGSIFRTVLPPAAGKAAPANLISSTVVHGRGESHGRRRRILVVDDEEVLGVTIRRTLSGEHEVTAVTTAKEALHLLRGEAQFDLVLCDLMMPEMTGMELYRELLRLQPEQAKKFVFMTGGSFTESATRFLTRISNPTIEKPIRAAKLRSLVRDLVQDLVQDVVQ